MKKTGRTVVFFLFLISVFFNSTNSRAEEIPTMDVEVYVEKAFIPAQGFDNNDRVQMILFGYLPNNCYSIKKDPIIEYNTANQQPVRIHQMATKRLDGVCGDEKKLPPHLSQPFAYTNEITLGRFEAGQYEIAYPISKNLDAVRRFTVAEALKASIDNMEYASVNPPVVKDIVRAGEKVFATLSGMLNSGCVSMADSPILERQDDVITALPKLIVKDSLFCPFVFSTFEKKFPIGEFSEGTYLFHVRSKDGWSKNKVFTVVTELNESPKKILKH